MSASRVPLSSLANGTVGQDIDNAFVPAPHAAASVYVHDPASTLWGGAKTPVSATVYSTELGGGVLSQPLTADSSGELPGWVAPGVDLDIVASFDGHTSGPGVAEPLVASSVVQDAPTDPTSPVVAASSPRNRALRDFVSVLDYGTFTSGDMTSPMLDAISDGTARGKRIYAPGQGSSNPYNVSAALTIPVSNGFWITGDHENTVIQQNTSNTRFLDMTTTGSIHDNIIEHLWFQSATQQTFASDPLAAAIHMATSNQVGYIFKNTFRGLRFDKMTYGLRFEPANPAVQMPFYDNLLDNWILTNIAGSLISNGTPAYPASPVGSPFNEARSIYHLGAGGSPGSAPALDLGAGVATQWVFNVLDVEDWTGQIMSAPHAAQIVIGGLHVERHTIAADNTAVFDFSDNTHFDIRGFQATWIIDNAGTAFVFYALPGTGHSQTTGGQGNIQGIDFDRDASSTGAATLQLLAADNTSDVKLGTRRYRNAAIIDYDPTGATYKAIKGYPPVQVPAATGLPIASSSWRSNWFYVQGASGVADRFVIGAKDGHDNYVLTNVLMSMRRFLAAASTNAAPTDRIIGCTGTGTTAQTITLQAATTFEPGHELIIKDEAGGAATHNITITANAADGIDGGALGGSITINTNHGVARIYCTGASGATAWNTY